MNKVWLYILIMALVTYLIRMLPFTLFNKKIKSTFVKSFLFYIPYAVLGAMTFPGILYSTGNMVTALFGMVAALILAYFKRSLLTVAVTACVTAYITQLIINFM